MAMPDEASVDGFSHEIQTYVHIHIYIHTYTVRIHTYIHSTHTYTCITCINTHTYIHTYILTYIHTFLHAYHTYIHSYIHTSLHTYIHTYIHSIMAMPDEASVDGFSHEIQTNHLSHFLLVSELMPLLEKAANSGGEARVVTHTSMARKTPATKLVAKYFEKNGYVCV